MITFLDLCSGIGGGRIGLEQAGFTCIGYSDTSRLAKRTYNLLFDTSNEFFCNNIRKLNFKNTPKCDLIIAGFPCQTFSVIGRKAGFDDNRGQLIFTLANILTYLQPKYFLFENVKGLKTHNKGKTLSLILEILENCGYKVYHNILTTLDYGVPQMRQRIYFVGIRKDLPHSKDFKWPDKQKSTIGFSDYLTEEMPITDINLMYFKKYLLNSSNNGKYKFENLLEKENSILDSRMNDLRIYEDKMPTLRSQRDGIYYVKNKKLYQLTGTEALLFQGFPKEKIMDLKNNVSDRHLLMQAGNAMSVNVIKEIGLKILETQEELL